MWLSCVNAEVDALVAQTGQVPPELVTLAAPNGKIAPHLGRRGGSSCARCRYDHAVLQHGRPIVGGYTPERVALRRAVSAYDAARDADPPWPGHPGAVADDAVHDGYDPAYKSEMSEYDPARARALLDMYGYRPRRRRLARAPGRQAWCCLRQPAGTDLPPVLTCAARPERHRPPGRVPGAAVASQLKQAQAGAADVVAGAVGGDPDGRPCCRPYGPQSATEPGALQAAGNGQLYEKRVDGRRPRAGQAVPGGQAPEHCVHALPLHRAPGRHRGPAPVLGYRRPVFWNNWYHWVDVDPDRRAPDEVAMQLPVTPHRRRRPAVAAAPSWSQAAAPAAERRCLFFRWPRRSTR